MCILIHLQEEESSEEVRMGICDFCRLYSDLFGIPLQTFFVLQVEESSVCWIQLHMQPIQGEGSAFLKQSGLLMTVHTAKLTNRTFI